MTNEQLYLAIGVPMLFNAITTMLLLAQFGAELRSVEEVIL